MKRITVQPGKCIGCRLCEAVCSLNRTGKIIPEESCITVRRDVEKDQCALEVCLQCSDKPCLDGCLVKAISVNQSTGAVSILEDKCDGCGKCIAACPNHAIKALGPEGVSRVCDLCGGDPLCAKVCPTGAISFEDLDDVSKDRQKLTLERKVNAWMSLGRGITDPPCVAACSTGALIVKSEGGVSFIKERCIGCLECIEFCPLGLSDIDQCSHSFACTEICTAGAVNNNYSVQQAP